IPLVGGLCMHIVRLSMQGIDFRHNLVDLRFEERRLVEKAQGLVMRSVAQHAHASQHGGDNGHAHGHLPVKRIVRMMLDVLGVFQMMCVPERHGYLTSMRVMAGNAFRYSLEPGLAARVLEGTTLSSDTELDASLSYLRLGISHPRLVLRESKSDSA